MPFPNVFVRKGTLQPDLISNPCHNPTLYLLCPEYSTKFLPIYFSLIRIYCVIHAFSKGIRPKKNVIARYDFEPMSQSHTLFTSLRVLQKVSSNLFFFNQNLLSDTLNNFNFNEACFIFLTTTSSLCLQWRKKLSVLLRKLHFPPYFSCYYSVFFVSAAQITVVPLCFSQPILHGDKSSQENLLRQQKMCHSIKVRNGE